jgi:hypothetical protein
VRNLAQQTMLFNNPRNRGIHLTRGGLPINILTDGDFIQHVPILRITAQDIIVPLNPKRPIRTAFGIIVIQQLFTHDWPIGADIKFPVNQRRDVNATGSVSRGMVHPNHTIGPDIAPYRGGGGEGGGGAAGGAEGGIPHIIGWQFGGNR